jgi:hypothetical protein
MADELGLVQGWQSSPLLPWVRLFGGLLIVFAGVWLVVAGPLFHRLWLDIIGAILLVLGGYLFSIGAKALHHTGS